MLKGKKSTAETIVYNAIETAAKREKDSPVDVLR
jgi:ribosomal protein S7